MYITTACADLQHVVKYKDSDMFQSTIPVWHTQPFTLAILLSVNTDHQHLQTF